MAPIQWDLNHWKQKSIKPEEGSSERINMTYGGQVKSGHSNVHHTIFVGVDGSLHFSSDQTLELMG